MWKQTWRFCASFPYVLLVAIIRHFAWKLPLKMLKRMRIETAGCNETLVGVVFVCVKNLIYRVLYYLLYFHPSLKISTTSYRWLFYQIHFILVELVFQDFFPGVHESGRISCSFEIWQIFTSAKFPCILDVSCCFFLWPPAGFLTNFFLAFWLSCL